MSSQDLGKQPVSALLGAECEGFCFFCFGRICAVCEPERYYAVMADLADGPKGQDGREQGSRDEPKSSPPGTDEGAGR